MNNQDVESSIQIDYDSRVGGEDVTTIDDTASVLNADPPPDKYSKAKADSYVYGRLADEAMPDKFWNILHILRTKWWLIALCIFVATASTSYFLNKITPIYRSVSLLEVKPQKHSVLDNGEIVYVVGDKDFLATQVELLKSRTLVQAVVENLNLLSDDYFYDADDPTWAAKSNDEKFRRVVDVFNRNLDVDLVGNSRLIEVSFQHFDPAKAAKITDTLTGSFIDKPLTLDVDAAAAARNLLQAQLASSKASVENAERALVDYMQANEIYTEGDNGQGAASLLDNASLTERLTLLENELSEVQSERLQLEQNLQQADAAELDTYVLSNPLVADMYRRQAALQSEYTDKQSVFKPKHPEMIELKSRIDTLNQEITQQTTDLAEARKAEIRANFNRVSALEQSLQSQLAELKSSITVKPSNSADYEALKLAVETEQAQYDKILIQLNDLVSSEQYVPDQVSILDPAQIPLEPFKPNKFQALLRAFFLSTAFGLSLAIVLDSLDDRVKTPNDIKSLLNQTIMGVIPFVEKGADITQHLHNSQTAISEAYASLRTNVQYFSPSGGPTVIQITSTRPNEGKSVSSLGLSLRFAGLQGRTLLIDADMRRPTFAPSEIGALGLSDILSADADFADYILPTHFNDLFLITSGASVPNPSELLSGKQFEALIEFARNHYDYVIIDSPPVLGLADAPIIGAKVDATLLVVEAAKLRAPAVQHTIERLRHSGTKIMGIVVTKYNAPSVGYMDAYSYSYGKASSDYGAIKGKKSRAKQKKRKLDITI